MEIYIYLHHCIFLTFLLGPFLQYLSHDQKGTRVLHAGKLECPASWCPRGCLTNSRASGGLDRRRSTGTLFNPRKDLSNHVTENSSRKKNKKNYIFNVKTNGASRTSQSIGCLQVLFYFVTVKRFHTHSRAVGSLVDCPKTQ